ncbi:hypothetical protein L484_002618 [Morus notabilis]|uniref:Uncharacterized protein n=1 Tax=Morus notabilis TaxID=981085 RepID=W9RP92_9ROSA|nr:hypothetical protein L484_002618 [Morus notabilis]
MESLSIKETLRPLTLVKSRPSLNAIHLAAKGKKEPEIFLENAPRTEPAESRTRPPTPIQELLGRTEASTFSLKLSLSGAIHF